MSKPIRWAILGTGAIAREFATGLQGLPDTELWAVGSRTLASADAFAQLFQVAKRYGSYAELVQDPDVDAIYIATPHTRHKDDCILCLDAGKAVLCEKPFTVNAREAQDVIAAARRNNVFCMEAMWMRFMPLIQRVKQLIDSGEIGDVRTLTAEFGYPTEYDPANRFFNPELAGGALLDRGSYGLSLAFYLFGAPSEVVGQACLGETGVDEQSGILLRYPDGKQALLAATLRTFGSNTATVTGTRGRIVIHEPFCRPDQISVTPLSDAPVVTTSQPPKSASGLKRQLAAYVKRSPLLKQLAAVARNRSHTITQPIEGNGFNYEAAEVMRCLRRGETESAIMPLAQSLQIMEVMDQLRQQWNLRYPQDG